MTTAITDQPSSLESQPNIDAKVASSEATTTSIISRAWRFAKRLAVDPMLQKSVLSILDQAIVSGTSFVTSVIVGRACGTTELGAYYLALTVVFFVRGIQEQLVFAPYMIYCGRKRGEETSLYAGSSLVHQLIVMLIAIVVMLGIDLAGIAPPALSSMLWLLIGVVPLLLMREYVRQISFAHLQPLAAVMVDVIVASLQLGTLAALAILGKLSVPLALAVMASSAGVAAVVWLFVKSQPYQLRLANAYRDWISNWKFARWALASQLLASSTPYVMPWIVALTQGEAETGVLGACATLVGLSNMFMLGLSNYLSPRAARAYAEGGVDALGGVLKQTAAIYAVSLGLMTIVSFAAGSMIASLVYGQSMPEASLLMGVLSLSVLANSMGVTAGNGLWAMEKPSASFWADMASLGIVVVATIVMIPLFGTLGAALATASGTICDAFIRSEILRRMMQEDRHRVTEQSAAQGSAA